MRVKRWVSLCIFPLIEKWMAAGEKVRRERFFKMFWNRAIGWHFASLLDFQ
jgi:rhamnogalacturonyl hydrolase YesR